MYVIHTSIPDPSAKIYVPTRIVLGCDEAAAQTVEKLAACGFDVYTDETDTTPERDDKEKERAAQLMLLLFMPAAGNA